MNCSATVLRMNFLLLKKQLLVVQLSKIRLACANSVPWAGHEPIYPPWCIKRKKESLQSPCRHLPTLWRLEAGYVKRAWTRGACLEMEISILEPIPCLGLWTTQIISFIFLDVRGRVTVSWE